MIISFSLENSYHESNFEASDSDALSECLNIRIWGAENPNVKPSKVLTYQNLILSYSEY